MNFVSVQIEYDGDLEYAAHLLGLASPFYDNDRDSRQEYEYVYGTFRGETIEINRAVGATRAGVFTHNNPSCFSNEAFAHVMSSFKMNGVKVVAYQTFENVKNGDVTNLDN